jgi:hypothetical protein
LTGKMIRKSLFINGAWAAPAGAGVFLSPKSLQL